MEEIIAPPSDDNANFTKYFNTNNAKCAILVHMSEKTILFFHTSVRQAWIKELDGAYRFAHAKGWRVQVIEPTKRPPAIQTLLDFWKPLGCIVECSGEFGHHFQGSIFGTTPVVYLGQDPRLIPPSASFVNPPTRGPGLCAAKELLTAGFTSFAFVASPRNFFWSRDREAEFRRTLWAHGYGCQVFGRHDRFKTEHQKSQALEKWIKALPRPSAVLAENDYQAIEVLDIARKLRIRIPQDLAVIGIDNDPALCENAKPTLSSVSLDFERAGYRALEILEQLIENPSQAPFQEAYTAQGLIRRGSTPFGIGTSPRVSKAIAYIRTKACDGISVADVARQMSGSRRLAEMDFRKATGRSIFDEILNVRFERVEMLLRNPSQVLGSIATQCGWKTENALRTAFLKRYGMSMRDWRTQSRKNNP